MYNFWISLAMSRESFHYLIFSFIPWITWNLVMNCTVDITEYHLKLIL